jgi:hypothetical protein
LPSDSVELLPAEGDRARIVPASNAALKLRFSRAIAAASRAAAPHSIDLFSLASSGLGKSCRDAAARACADRLSLPDHTRLKHGAERTLPRRPRPGPGRLLRTRRRGFSKGPRESCGRRSRRGPLQGRRPIEDDSLRRSRWHPHVVCHRLLVRRLGTHQSRSPAPGSLQHFGRRHGHGCWGIFINKIIR